MHAALEEFAEKAAAIVERHGDQGQRLSDAGQDGGRDADADAGVVGVVGGGGGGGRKTGAGEGQLEVEYRLACTREAFERHVATLTALFGKPATQADTVLYFAPPKVSPVRCVVDRAGRVQSVDSKTDLYTRVFGSTDVGGVRVPLVAKCCLEASVQGSLRDRVREASEALSAPPMFTRTTPDAPEQAFLLTHWRDLPFMRVGERKGDGTDVFALMPGKAAGKHFAFGGAIMRTRLAVDDALLQQVKSRERATFTSVEQGFHVDCTMFQLRRSPSGKPVEGQPRYNIEVEMDTDMNLRFPTMLRFLLAPGHDEEP
jgi:hypothetical protein